MHGIDIMGLLDARDLTGGPVGSLLDCTILDDLVAQMLTPPANPADASPPARPYLANPLRVTVTVSNLNGVPFWTSSLGTGSAGYGATAHADLMRFAVTIPSGTPDPVAPQPLADEIALSGPTSPRNAAWAGFGQAALGSGAFPVALKPRVLSRPGSHYDAVLPYHPTLPAADAPCVGWSSLKPWSGNASAEVTFTVVDGGALYNEPLEVGRRVLAGARGRLPRDGMRAFGASVLIDPFPDKPDSKDLDARTDTLFAVLKGLLGAWLSQARYRADDLALAAEPNTYSRFVIAPDRGSAGAASNNQHLACGLMGGFGGFLHRSLREHDYYLGRRNCQWFLRTVFMLPRGNPLFDGWRDQPWAAEYADGDVHLPIIPLMAPLRPPLTPPSPGSGRAGAEVIEPLPAWPDPGLIPVDAIVARAMKRLKLIRPRLIEDMISHRGGRLLLKVGSWIAVHTALAGMLRDTLHEAIGKFFGTLPPPPPLPPPPQTQPHTDPHAGPGTA